MLPISRRAAASRFSIRLYSSYKPGPTKENYDKAAFYVPEPVTTHSGSKTYVVSEPDPRDKHYEVPSGAYASTSPYDAQQESAPPNPNNSSASASSAHPVTTKAAPQNPSGVGSSSSVRYRSAPGEMAAGSDGGMDLMDKSGTTNLEQEGMASRNVQPKGEEEGKLGLKEAWKHRK